MRVLVLGTGLMGPAAAFDAMADPAVSRVGLCDASERQRDAALRHDGVVAGGEGDRRRRVGAGPRLMW